MVDNDDSALAAGLGNQSSTAVADTEAPSPAAAASGSSLDEAMSANKALLERKAKVDAEREAALAAVPVAATDIDALAADFDIARPLAERVLRIVGGDLARARRHLVVGPDAQAAP